MPLVLSVTRLSYKGSDGYSLTVLLATRRFTALAAPRPEDQRARVSGTPFGLSALESRTGIRIG